MAGKDWSQAGRDRSGAWDMTATQHAPNPPGDWPKGNQTPSTPSTRSPRTLALHRQYDPAALPYGTALTIGTARACADAGHARRRQKEERLPCMGRGQSLSPL